jgi:hypothetical protein
MFCGQKHLNKTEGKGSAEKRSPGEEFASSQGQLLEAFVDEIIVDR